MLFTKKKNTTPNARKGVNISSDAAGGSERAASTKRIIGDDTSFDVREAYKACRTNIMFSLNNEAGCKKVIISSATSGEGKSTTCVNLAKTFAETGARVLLIDADLRAPRIHKYLKTSNEKGLSNILAGFDKLDNCVIHTERENMDCITSGAIPPNPVELISSDNMKELLAEVENRYDYIFIDTPPINIVTEALLLSKLVNGVILVTRQKFTMYKMVERAIESLQFAEAKIIGFVLNDAEGNDMMYSGGYRQNKKRKRYGYYYASRSYAAPKTGASSGKSQKSE